MQNNLNATRTRSFAAAVKNAMHGIRDFFKSERNGKIQASVAVIVLLAAAFLHLSSTEWMFILMCIGLVLTAEMLNSALEHLCNLVHGDYHPLVRKIKDVSAGAVLIASIVSVITGLIIFIPKIIGSL